MARVRKVVFPVAGLGTRMLPATKVLPKEMLPVVDRPIIQYALEEAAAAGAEEFIFVTGRGKTIMEDHFDRGLRAVRDPGREGEDQGAERARAGGADGRATWSTPASRSQGAGPRRLVRAPRRRRRAVRGDAGRRSDRCRARPAWRRWSMRRRRPSGNMLAVDGGAAGAHLALRRDRPGCHGWTA